MRYMNTVAIDNAIADNEQLSSVIDARFITSISVQVEFSGGGSPLGLFSVQMSNDAPGDPVQWSDISDSVISIPDDGTYVIPKVDVCAQWIRIAWEPQSGSGSTLFATVKTIGY